MEVLCIFIALGHLLSQDQDCQCLGNWVQVQDGAPFSYDRGPYFLHSEQTVLCDPKTVASHGHDRWKLAACLESGGSCSTLSWITELQELFQDSHTITIQVPSYTIAGGYESREELTYLTGTRTQAFECRVNGVAQKKLQRTRQIDYGHEISVTFIKIRECPIAEPPAG